MSTMSNFPSVGHADWRDEALLLPLAGLDPERAGCIPGLRLRVLRTAQEREAIAGLRRHAAFRVEQDLGLGLQPFEQIRDEMGLVTAVYRDERPLATLRFVPTGQGLTGAERLLEKMPFDASILGAGSWEVGRVIMEPEDRAPDLLLECLTVTLKDLMQMEDVRHFHATTTLAMARLWRRVGLHTVVTATGESGGRYALVHGRVEDVAAALHLRVPGVRPQAACAHRETGVAAVASV
ncbi:hypothetical protein [Ramlibacter alkalitolerans]|uniref:GNAT family N-acetyltransferase n=2 Tax=Ramlibacter alkalitolerans TaxID=2039631 RepID=A0ABS1JTN0_9BURK|nr:hypothetical protein [Ramlibacter alkalitolerans]